MFAIRPPLRDVRPTDGDDYGYGSVYDNSHHHLEQLAAAEETEQFTQRYTYKAGVNSGEMEAFFALKPHVLDGYIPGYALDVECTENSATEISDRYRSQVSRYTLKFAVTGPLSEINRFAREYGFPEIKGNAQTLLTPRDAHYSTRCWSDATQAAFLRTLTEVRDEFSMLDITHKSGRWIPVGQDNVLTLSGPNFYVCQALQRLRV